MYKQSNTPIQQAVLNISPVYRHRKRTATRTGEGACSYMTSVLRSGCSAPIPLALELGLHLRESLLHVLILRQFLDQDLVVSQGRFPSLQLNTHDHTKKTAAKIRSPVSAFAVKNQTFRTGRLQLQNSKRTLTLQSALLSRALL